MSDSIRDSQQDIATIKEFFSYLARAAKANNAGWEHDVLAEAEVGPSTSQYTSKHLPYEAVIKLAVLDPNNPNTGGTVFEWGIMPFVRSQLAEVAPGMSEFKQGENGEKFMVFPGKKGSAEISGLLGMYDIIEYDTLNVGINPPLVDAMQNFLNRKRTETPELFEDPQAGMSPLDKEVAGMMSGARNWLDSLLELNGGEIAVNAFESYVRAALTASVTPNRSSIAGRTEAREAFIEAFANLNIGGIKPEDEKTFADSMLMLHTDQFIPERARRIRLAQSSEEQSPGAQGRR